MATDRDRAPADRATTGRPPSVDALARSLSGVGLPSAICVDIAREAIAAGEPESAEARARAFRRTLLMPVVNATGVLLHTNLGRAPIGAHQPERPTNVELDLATGERGSRQRPVGQLLAKLCGAEAAMVVNNNAGAVMLVLAALAFDRGVAVSRGESVEIGGAFRVPDVMEQSGATLVDVGTTNRTRIADYAAAIERGRGPGGSPPIALTMKVHPSNFRVEGFVESTSVLELSALGVPVVADIGSGLIDANCPWLSGPPPAWLAGEPGARQNLEAGAALVTFSGDKLFGGPQAGIIVGRRDLVDRCARHPLARALRPGGMVLAALQATAISYLDRTVTRDVAFWRMVAAPIDVLQQRAAALCAATTGVHQEASTAMPGAGSAPGATMPSVAVVIDGDHLAHFRGRPTPIIGRVRDGRTLLDLRSVDPDDDVLVGAALAAR
ncbi:MAG: selA [Ilumatobacteraceae bacterium]|nr:selA [Ilumatobacteraceae bacterium]